MKPEPLKDKGKKIVLDGHLYFKDEDIELAVEWLIGQFETMDIPSRCNLSCIKNIIEQAFPDIQLSQDRSKNG